MTRFNPHTSDPKSVSNREWNAFPKRAWPMCRTKCRDIYLESPKKLIWPNLNKPATGGFDRTMSQKSQFLGFEPFLEGSCGPQTENFGKIETRVQRHLSRVPKKPHMAKFEQTSNRGLWPDDVTKITIFGFLAIFRGLVRASDWKFWKNWN